MGYIPPVGDPQFLQYGNRLLEKKSSVKHISPVIEGEFQGPLEKKSSRQTQVNTKKNKNQSRQLNAEKGKFIDEIV
ncbi:hypothetical protein H1D32_23330 [Anaerobacillus sp. CMMVII]|uniref:hypothetical protein n=1 Tax=Anaerobacillus sp. CMMVII TaxID=2755588 RepID=UPI0021B8253B|nr:hypothetical protein [Anaerobacillus sp. CMMVII]MCT8140370.1 hypothetical protein [Anaerobacillus sp. CMMVII]